MSQMEKAQDVWAPCLVVVPQALPKIFSAGLDILEMYGKSPERCGEFWRAVQELWLKFYSSRLVTIAAINVRANAQDVELSYAVFVEKWNHGTRRLLGCVL